MRYAALLAGLALAACARETAAPTAAPASFALRRVSTEALAQVPSAPPAPQPAANDVAGLRTTIADRAHLAGKLRALALADAVAGGEAAVAAAKALLADAQASDEEKRSALEVLGAIDTPASSAALLRLVDIQSERVPWIRAQAAFQLAKLSDDRVLPQLSAQLKYESDGETVIWIAAGLAKHHNYAGLDGLRVLAANGNAPQVQADARAELDAIASEAGFADADALYAAWNSPEAATKLPRAEPSPALREQIWRRIAQLGEFDLRLVDDARFALSRSAAWVVEPLAAALHEEEPHMRVHVAQSLERMGPRAAGACAELVRALEEPRVAPAAATALAGIGCRDAIEALVRCTQAGRDPELRGSAARALGVLGSQPALDALTQLLAKADTPDLRQTAAEALVDLGKGALAAPLLVECLTRPGADHDTAEAALERWLEREARTQDPAAAETLAAWRALAGDANTTPSVAQTTARHAARAALLSKRK